MAARSLEALYSGCTLPFQLVVVDGATPEPYRREMKSVLDGRPNVEFVTHPGYLLPNKARRLGTEKATGDLILYLENDCLIRPGAVEALVALAADYPAGVAVPWLWEKTARHHDSSAVKVERLPDGTLRLHAEKEPLKLEGGRRPVEFFEHHCFLITRPALAILGTGDEELNTREAIEISVAAWSAKIPVILEPAAQVEFHAPPPVCADERDFFDYRWDPKRADESHERVSSRWKIVDMPGTYDFVREQMLRKSHATWALIRARSLLRRIRDWVAK